MSLTPASSTQPGSLDARAEGICRRFNLGGLEWDPLFAAEPELAFKSLDELEAKLDLLARIIQSRGAEAGASARAVGLGASYRAQLLSPQAMTERYGEGSSVGASLDPASATLHLAARSPSGDPAGCASHFAHEWAHALDYCLAGALGSIKAPSRAAKNLAERLEAVVGALFERPRIPFQGAVGALLREMADQELAGPAPFSAGGARKDPGPNAQPALSAFSALVARLSPRPAGSLSKTERSELRKNAKSQLAFLGESVRDCALMCCERDERLRRLLPDELSRARFSEYCARVTRARAKEEASGRRGRESAFDGAKADIAVMLSRGFNQPAAQAREIANAIFHIAPIKIERAGDAFFAEPYTGRSHWDASGSLADLSCAMIRALRNDKALQNSALSKERVVPLSYWWTTRREVSRSAALASRHALAFIDMAAHLGSAPAEPAKNALRWARERGVYAPGATLFCDLSGTGERMLGREAELNGSNLSREELKSLRSELSSPAKTLGARAAAREGVAESIEQLFVSLANRPASDPLGALAREGLRRGLVDNDQDEISDSLSPAKGWLNSKSEQFERNQADWLRLLGALPKALEAFEPSQTPPPSPARAKRTGGP